MKRKLFSLVGFLLGIMTISAQAPQLTPLPIMEGVKHGTLPNGLNYYILHNEQPKERANFYIAQKVGSTLETPEQLGLAHFLEHMAFNGTKNYSGKKMLDYLQTKGIRFGADINAYTSFDETVYNIDNVPTNDQALMDSVLLVLHDWSGSLLLEDDEIEAERGVIREEWRQRNSAQIRKLTAMLPAIYKEYQYQQMPIGKMDIVMNFKPEVLRAYYKKWYRPDQQGIVIVGDFDAAAMEKKVIELFSKIPMPANAAERTYPEVSDNKEPIFFTFQDPEQQFTLIETAFKYDKTPFEMRNTQEGYIGDILIPQMIQVMINNRLEEYAQNPECPYAAANARFDDFYVSKTKGAFSIIVVPKGNDIAKAYNCVMEIVARACKTGFTDSEIVRTRDQILANYEKLFNEKDKTSNTNLGQELIRLFVDNTPAPGITTERQLAQMVLNAVPASAYNETCKQLLTPENQVIVISAPEGVEVINKDEAVGIVNNAINKEYEAYVDEVITDPLIARLPEPGIVKSATSNAQTGTKTYVLGNGVKVVVKPTDFAADEIMINAFREGGKRAFNPSQAADVLFAGSAYDMTKMGPFTPVQLQKYLAGKKVALNYEINNFTTSLAGSATKKDLPTLMEMIYASFTALSPDQQSYEAQLGMLKAVMENYEKNPEFVFQQHIQSAQHSGNPLFMSPTVKTLEAANYDNMLSIIKNDLSNAANYTFIIVGNVDEETLLPLLKQYVATLPSTGKAEKVNTITSPGDASGIIKDEFNQKTNEPIVNVYDMISGGKMKYSIENDIKTTLIGDVLDILYTASLREKEGGTYGAQTYSYLNPNTKQWHVIYTFQTNPDQQAKLRQMAYDELMDLLNNGAKEEHFSKVRLAAIKQLEIQERKNGFWLNNLMNIERGFDTMTNRKAVLENLTLADFNAFMKKLYKGKDRVEVVMNGNPNF